MTQYITIFDNDKILPVCESERIDCDPSCYMGEPTYCAGSLKVWSVGDLRVILSRNVLTSAP